MTDHDALYHRLFSRPLMVEHLVRAFVPEAMAAGLQFDRMERVNAKAHAEALDGTSHRREGDVIWRLPIEGGLDLYLYFLLEFQSAVDWWMAVRTQIYEGLLWQQIIAEKKLRPGDTLPPVLMVVLYNGETRWTAPDDTAALIALPPNSSLWPWQPRSRYHILDMGAVDCDRLDESDNIAGLLFRLEQPLPPEAFGALIGEVIDWFRRHPDHEALRRLFSELVHHTMTGLGAELPNRVELPEMQTMASKLPEIWKRQYLAEGRAEGEARGKAEGLAEGKANALILLAEQRFGPLPQTLRDRVEHADAAAIETWLGRLLAATSLESLFGSAN
jgi:hypothetical protein